MYLPSEHPAIRRHFVNLENRQVHFRVAGSGPLLLVLHQSPTSSAEMATEIEAFARHFTVICVDTPGCGLSDPLPDEKPELTDYAEALNDFVTELGLERFLIYGYHTGAIIGFEFVRLYPDKCSGAVINGLAVIEGDELEDMLEHYNVVPAPVADGGHLHWVWARLRDQKLFFPWYRKQPDARMALDAGDGQSMHPYLLDFLRAEAGGRKPYQAAFAYPTRRRMPEMRVPIYLVNIGLDPLAPHPERLDGFAACVERRVFSDPILMRDKILGFLLDHAGDDVDMPDTSVGRFHGLFRSEIVNTPGGPVFVRISSPGPEGAVVFLHDAGASSRRLEPVASRLARDWGGKRQIVLIDLPGHGETCAQHLPGFSPAGISILLDMVLQELDLANIDIVAEGAGCIIATDFANERSDSVAHLVLIDPWLFDASERVEMAAGYAPDLAAGDYGQHLALAWYFVRDSELFWPWHAPLAANALKRAPEIGAEEVHERVVDVLKSSRSLQRFVAAMLHADFSTALATSQVPVFCCARSGGGHEERAEAAARLGPHGTYNKLSGDRKLWAAEIVEMLKVRH